MSTSTRKIRKTSSTITVPAQPGSGGQGISSAIPIVYPANCLYVIFVWRWRQSASGSNYLSHLQLANWNPVTAALGTYASYGSNFFKNAGVSAGFTGGTGTPSNGVPVNYATNSGNGTGPTSTNFNNLPLVDLDNLDPSLEGRGVGFFVRDGDSVRFLSATNSAAPGPAGASGINTMVYDIYYIF